MNNIMDIWNKINKPYDREYITDLWYDLSKTLEKDLLPDISKFKEHPIIKQTMTCDGASYIEYEKEYLKNTGRHDDETLSHMSDLSIHHSFHGAKHYDIIGINTSYEEWQNLDFMIEWGGGFGDLAALIAMNYIIVDIPIISLIQYYNLSNDDNRFIKSYINIIHDDNLTIQQNQINLLPLPFLDQMRNKLRCNLFISTWALSESGKKSIDFVLNNNFFGAKHLLLAYEKSRHDKLPYTCMLEENLKSDPNVKIINIDHIGPNQFYLFK